MNFIDLFAGAGGLSEGFIKAGFEPLAHVEMDKAACFTLKTRAVYHELDRQDRLYIYEDYLKGKISREELYSSVDPSILKSVINSKIGGRNNDKIFQTIDEIRNGDEVDLIVGGPPCQAYSMMGRAALGVKAEKDERNFLYREYARFLKKFNPRFFVFENVPGLKTALGGKAYKNIKRLYKKHGYEIEDKLLNAWDFGVVQDRERLIIIGRRQDVEFSYPDFEKITNTGTANDVFRDLPALNHGEGKRFVKYGSTPPSQYVRDAGIRNGLEFVTQHIARPHNDRDRNIYKMAIELAIKGVRIKNNMIPEKERTQKNVKDFLDRFKVVYGKPHTMIAHIAKDGHHFIHPDIKKLRSISVREAARIQSFPDNYYFEGVKENQNRTAAFKQIGNAVPPLMAYAIAQKMKELICKKKR